MTKNLLKEIKEALNEGGYKRSPEEENELLRRFKESPSGKDAIQKFKESVRTSIMELDADFTGDSIETEQDDTTVSALITLTNEILEDLKISRDF